MKKIIAIIIIATVLSALFGPAVLSLLSWCFSTLANITKFILPWVFNALAGICDFLIKVLAWLGIKGII